MTHIYLHLRDHTEEILYPDGVEMRDLDAVKKAVLDAARDVISNEIKSNGLMDLRYRIDAENKAGEVIHTLAFADAVRIIPEIA